MAKFDCIECHVPVDTSFYINPEELIERKLCQTCLHFQEILDCKMKDIVVIDGTVWRIRSPKSSPDENRGCYGRLHRIKLLCECGFEFETTNLWRLGDIPEHFLSRFPNTAKFLD